jgi:hypothetical protein
LQLLQLWQKKSRPCTLFLQADTDQQSNAASVSHLTHHCCLLQLLPLGPSASERLPVVACRDCCVRIMGLDGKPLFEVATGSPPTAVRCETIALPVL